MRQDYGYSNWTVEGTTVDCLRSVHPDLPLDTYVETPLFEAAMAFGESCSVRVEGEGPWFDCDRETPVEDACGGDAELIALCEKGNVP